LEGIGSAQAPGRSRLSGFCSGAISSIPGLTWPPAKNFTPPLPFCRLLICALPHRFHQIYKSPPGTPRFHLIFSFFFSSLCLFVPPLHAWPMGKRANQLVSTVWLRSSVVSVLFSLISERSLLRPIVIILIFGFGELASVLAHVSSHRVPGITLPPGDAKSFFHCCLRLDWGCEEKNCCNSGSWWRRRDWCVLQLQRLLTRAP
jgi:hypothetical protein